MDSKTEKLWYLVQCKPKQDFRALEHLERQGYECLLPMHKVDRLKKGKFQVQEEPLFPGYLFIELDTLQDNWLPIRSTRGVNQVVRFGAEPVPVPRNIIDQLQQKIGLLEQTLKPGDKVHWAGKLCLDAIFVAKEGEERVTLLLTLLQRQIKVSASLQWLIEAD